MDGFQLVATPSPTLPTRGRVPAGGLGRTVQRAPDSTLPLVGRAGEGVQLTLRSEEAFR